MAPSSNTPALSCTIDDDNRGITISCADGNGINLRLHEMRESLITQATLHGFKQKLMDAGAISRDPVTGRSATPTDKFLAIREVYDRLVAGEWNKTREGGSPTGGLLLTALMTVYPTKTKDQLVAFLASKTAEEKTALRKVAKIAEAIEVIKAARVKTDGIDGDALLDGLED